MRNSLSFRGFGTDERCCCNQLLIIDILIKKINLLIHTTVEFEQFLPVDFSVVIAKII